jgi:hypothetical protein
MWLGSAGVHKRKAHKVRLNIVLPRSIGIVATETGIVDNDQNVFPGKKCSERRLHGRNDCYTFVQHQVVDGLENVDMVLVCATTTPTCRLLII